MRLQTYNKDGFLIGTTRVVENTDTKRDVGYGIAYVGVVLCFFGWLIKFLNL